jgi:Tfp pilus assembly major pilin PilA
MRKKIIGIAGFVGIVLVLAALAVTAFDRAGAKAKHTTQEAAKAFAVEADKSLAAQSLAVAREKCVVTKAGQPVDGNTGEQFGCIVAIGSLATGELAVCTQAIFEYPAGASSVDLSTAKVTKIDPKYCK